MADQNITATITCPRCDGQGRELIGLGGDWSTIPCPGADADPPGCDGRGFVPAPQNGSYSTLEKD